MHQAAVPQARICVMLQTISDISLHKLPFVDQCGLVKSEINLILHTVGRINNRLDGCVYDFPGVHLDFDFVADLALLWGWVGFVRHGVIVRQTTRG
jgi:hypothetical protein